MLDAAMDILAAFALLDPLPRILLTAGLAALSGWVVVSGLQLTRR